MGWGCHGSEEGVSSMCEELGLEKGGGGGKVEEEEITLRDTMRISEFQTFETTRVSVCCFKLLRGIPCSGNLRKLK